MRKLESAVVFVSLLLVHSAFGQECASCSSFLQVGTWNTNLTPGSTLYQLERSQEAIRFLGTNTTFDLMCLQDVYSMTDQMAFISGLNQTFPYSFAAPVASQNCSMTCSSENVATLTNCSSMCSSLSGQEGTNCLYQNCGAELGSLPVECQMCLGISGTGTFGSTLTGCTGSNETMSTQGCKYLFGGSSGNLVLSKYAFTATRFLTFNSTAGVASGALHVRIDYNGTPVNFFCTSLEPSSTPYPTGTDTSQINQMQTMELMDWIKSGVSNNEPIIVAGSFSQSPESGSGSGVDTQNYNLWTSAGYESALAVLSQGQLPCTLCSGNNTGVMVDHIFVKTDSMPAPCIQSAGVFGSQTTVTTSSGSVPISQHSGVSASMCFTNETVTPTVAPTVMPTAAPTVAPSIAPTFSPVVVPVASVPAQEASEGGIAVPAVVLAAVLVGVAMLLNR